LPITVSYTVCFNVLPNALQVISVFPANHLAGISKPHLITTKWQDKTSIPRAARLNWLENAYSCSLFWRAIL